MFDIIEKAGVSQQEFAGLVGVSRIIVNKWCRGKATPGPHTECSTKRILLILRYAVQKGILPGALPVSSKRTTLTRKQILDRLVADITKELKARAKDKQ